MLPMRQNCFSEIGVIGAGSFGTALANSFATAGLRVILWGRDIAAVQSIVDAQSNPEYLPNVVLSDKLLATGDLEELSKCSVIVLATPAQTTRVLVAGLSWAADKKILLTAKGIERKTGALQSEIVSEHLPKASIAVLSGPSFAAEIAAGKPTALTLGVEDKVQGMELQERLSSERIRLYLSDDSRGIQLGGALKNVVAIAAGIIMGAGFGESARAAVITRGFSEMSRLAMVMGARATTLTGLSGIGDLVLTATSEKSRNYAFGLEVGKSGSLDFTKTVEGFETAMASASLAQKHGVDMPITKAVANILSGESRIDECVDQIMRRPLSDE